MDYIYKQCKHFFKYDFILESKNPFHFTSASHLESCLEISLVRETIPRYPKIEAILGLVLKTKSISHSLCHVGMNYVWCDKHEWWKCGASAAGLWSDPLGPMRVLRPIPLLLYLARVFINSGRYGEKVFISFPATLTISSRHLVCWISTDIPSSDPVMMRMRWLEKGVYLIGIFY